MPITLANAPCSWGVDYADAPDNPDPERVFAEIARAGYAHAELGPYGYAPTDAAALAAFLDRHELALAGGFLFEPLHDPARRDDVLAKAERLVPLLERTGARVLVLIDHISPGRERTAGRSDAAERLDGGRFRAMIALIERLGATARRGGLRAVLHHHAGSTIEFDDEIERVMHAVSPDLLGLCVDTGHAAYSGLDPVALARRYGARVRHVHLKDVDPAVHRGVLAERVGFDDAVARGVFTPIGRGGVDFAAVARVLDRAGYDGFATIEQDVDPSTTSPDAPLRSAIESRTFLEKADKAYKSG